MKIKKFRELNESNKKKINIENYKYIYDLSDDVDISVEDLIQLSEEYVFENIEDITYDEKLDWWYILTATDALNFSGDDFLKKINNSIKNISRESAGFGGYYTVDDLYKKLKDLKNNGYGDKKILFTLGGSYDFEEVTYISETETDDGIVIGKQSW